MQQTEKYKLNKPGVDDPIAIAPLNENMDKVEAALVAETAARQSADAAETAARQSADAAETAARQSADTAETQARTAADTAETQARTAADTALGNRVTVLENQKVRMAAGTYKGNGAGPRTISTGFTVKAIVIRAPDTYSSWVSGETPYKDENGNTILQFVSNGFSLITEKSAALNISGRRYEYIAFG